MESLYVREDHLRSSSWAGRKPGIRLAQAGRSGACKLCFRGPTPRLQDPYMACQPESTRASPEQAAKVCLRGIFEMGRVAQQFMQIMAEPIQGPFGDSYQTKPSELELSRQEPKKAQGAQRKPAKMRREPRDLSASCWRVLAGLKETSLNTESATSADFEWVGSSWWLRGAYFEHCKRAFCDGSTRVSCRSLTSMCDLHRASSRATRAT